MAELCYINYGAQMSSKKKGAFGKEHVIRPSKVYDNCRPMISGKELYRYELRWAKRFVDWSFALQMYGPRWPEFFEQPKLMIRDITGTHRIEATFDKLGYYCDHTVLCAHRKCDVAKWKEATADELTLSAQYDARFLAGMVGSKVVTAYFYLMLTGEGVRTGGGFHTYPHTIQQFPIFRLDFSSKADQKRHAQIVAMVDQMLETKKLLADSKTDSKKTYYSNKCAVIDHEIDQAVFGFFELTPAEIANVESVAV